jgi:hypothetical protein
MIRHTSTPRTGRSPRLVSVLAVTLAAVAMAGMSGCSGEEGEPGLGQMNTVQVWFSRDETPVAQERRVGGAPLDGALRALVLGPPQEERADGIHSWFSTETRGVIPRLRAEDGHVTVDFRDLPDLIPNASSSAGSQQLVTSLDSTVFQFDWVDSVEYRLEGSCDAFWEWLQGECHVRTRDGPVTDPGA